MTNQRTKKIIVLGSILFSFLFVSINTFAYSCTGYSCESYRYSPYNPYNQENQNGSYAQYDYSQTVVPVPYMANNTKTNTTPTVINNYYYQNEDTPNNTTTVNEETNSYSSTENNSSTKNNNQQIEDDYYRNNLGASAYDGYDQSQGNEITALSLRGSGSFMPSSIWQWILVVILILAIIIIARMFVRKPHPSDHDTHVAHAH